MITYDPFDWPDESPEDFPFPDSPKFGGLRILGEAGDYHIADTIYPSWGADDLLYAPFTDGSVEGMASSSSGYLHSFQTAEHEFFDHAGIAADAVGAIQNKATTGHMALIGDDPLNLKFEAIGLDAAAPYPYGGRYPCGSLHHNGIWYYGTYCLSPFGQVKWGAREKDYTWPWMGPLVGFRVSKDNGKTWEATPHTPTNPLFGENGLCGYPVKIGAPHFVDFGRNMEHSPDGKAYLLAQGSDPKFYPSEKMHRLSWITADQIYLLRVTPSPETINDPDAYEFFGGYGQDGTPIWTSDFSAIQPLLEWEGNMGCVTATWHPGIQRYLMFVTDGGDTVSSMHSYILESESLTGPWRKITYMKHFGHEAYFINAPSKFINREGLDFWILYSSCTNGDGLPYKMPGSRYGMAVQHVELIPRGE